MQADEGAALELLKSCRAAIQRAVEQHSGRIVNAPGDSMLAEFPSAVEAVRCAAEIQHDLKHSNSALPPEQRMDYRIGVNLGEVIEESDGTLYGDGVNIAARLEGLAEAGGVCLSGKVFDEVERRLDLPLDYVGEHAVKNIAKPVRVYRLRSEAAAAPRATRRRLGPRARISLVGAAALIVVAVAAALTWQVGRSPPEGEDRVLVMPQGPSIAVLPFVNLSGDPKEEYFADGLSEQIITELSRFRELLVMARNTTFQYKGQAADIRKVGRELGVRYVLEGSVRKAGGKIRVTAQLIDVSTGGHLWAKTYDRDLSAASVFAIQDAITEDVAGQIGGVHGIMSRAAVEERARTRPDQLTSYDCVLRAYEFYRVYTKEKHLVARDCLERVVQDDPGYAELWAHLAQIYAEEFGAHYNARPDSLARGLKAALRAVELDPRSQMAYYNLAYVQFYMGHVDEFFDAAERAIALNTNNTEVLGFLGIFIHQAGRYEQGLALSKKAVALNPNPPGWHYFAFVNERCRKGEDEEALAWAKKLDLPDYFGTQVV
jgi:adenylate cyclase